MAHKKGCAILPYVGRSMIEDYAPYKPCDCGFDPRPKDYFSVTDRWGRLDPPKVWRGNTMEAGRYRLETHEPGKYPPLVCYAKDVAPGEHKILHVSLQPIRPMNMKIAILGDKVLRDNTVYPAYMDGNFLVEILRKYDE